MTVYGALQKERSHRGRLHTGTRSEKGQHGVAAQQDDSTDVRYIKSLGFKE